MKNEDRSALNEMKMETKIILPLSHTPSLKRHTKRNIRFDGLNVQVMNPLR